LISFLLFLASRSVVWGQMIAQADAIQDLKIFERAAQNGHPASLFHPISFERILQKLATGPDSIPTFLFRLMLGECLQEIGCVHTSALKNPLEKPIKRFFPYSLEQHDSRIFISGAKDSSMIGKEILNINGAPAPFLLDLVSKMSSNDGKEQFIGAHVAKRNASFLIAKVLSVPDTFFLQTPLRNYVLAAADSIVMPSVIPIPFRKVSATNYTYFGTDDQTAYLKMSAFKSKERRFHRKSMAKVREKRLKYFILDLRGNGGGDRRTSAALCQMLVNERFGYTIEQPRGLKSFRYLSAKGKLDQVMGNFFYYTKYILHLRIQRDRNIFKYSYRPKKKRFEGKIYVLCDGLSASSSGMAITWLKNHSNATFVGEPTGGGYGGNYGGLFPSLRLQKTRIKVRFPLCPLVYDDFKGKFEAFYPEHKVSQKPSDRMLKKDTALEFTKQLIANQKD
jgi:Peptidase family S41